MSVEIYRALRAANVADLLWSALGTLGVLTMLVGGLLWLAIDTRDQLAALRAEVAQLAEQLTEGLKP